MLHTVLGHCGIELCHQFLKDRILNISATLFEVAILNFVCGCILMLKITACFFCAIVTLTVDLSFIKNVYRAYLLVYYIIKNSQMVCGHIFWQ